MTLDLNGVSRQIRKMGEELQAHGTDLGQRLDKAVNALRSHASSFEELRVKIECSKTYWPVARPVEPLNARHSLPPRPESYTIIATDGSQIEPDRHRAALCYLLNVGTVLLRYGADSKAVLQSHPMLAYSDDDLYIVSGNRRFLVQGHLLTVKRSIAETDILASTSERSIDGSPIVGLQDGTLILQTLEGFGVEDELRDKLTGQFLDRLTMLRELGVPLASYISRPRASDVSNALRIAACPNATANCGQHCREYLASDSEPCAWLAALPDRSVFELLPLEEGERSGLFLSSSKISLDRYGEHKVYFFYLNVGREIARVELPEWVARDARLLPLVHSAIFDQCQRGDGYPRALAEAHEKAVIGGADREVFWRLVESTLVGNRLSTKTSEKERSKRIRGL